jgi:ribosomal protein S18 acetylase RimI-like enzyme
MVGKAMLDVLREDLAPVDDDIEGAAASRRSRRFEPELPGDGGRQTGGLGPIVSTDAVLDGDLHREIISFMNKILPAWRPAREDDYDDLVEMSLALYASDPPTRSVTEAQIRATLAKFRAEPARGLAVVLDSGSGAIGYALLVSFLSNELGGEICTIDELFIRDGWRSRGFGSRLIDAIEAGGTIWPGHPVALELEVSPGNARALALYERLGFRLKRNACMRRVLSPGA